MRFNFKKLNHYFLFIYLFFPLENYNFEKSIMKVFWDNIFILKPKIRGNIHSNIGPHHMPVKVNVMKKIINQFSI